MFWGLTPCINLLEETSKSDTINILIVGGCDARHVLKTISKSYGRPGIKINFYLMELVPEIIAKELLLLNIGLQSVEELGIIQKARTFLEIFGNTLVRPPTAKFVNIRAANLMEMITDYEDLHRQMPYITLELKYKERDYIENLYKFWSCGDDFQIVDSWDRRLRKTLGVRYDTRNAAFDWDLHMRLHHIGAHFINNQEYQSFRRSGVAFTWLESEVTKPNRSMVTGVIPNGDHFGHYGYLGEMQTGPFIAYGIQCDDKEYNKKSNMAYKHRATDVSERNLLEIFHELEFGQEYQHRSTNDIALGSCVMQVSELKVVDCSGNGEKGGRDDKKKYTAIPLPHVAINFISINHLAMMQHKIHYKDFFDVVYFAYNALKHVDGNVIGHVASENCILIFENPLFVISIRDAELKKHQEEIIDKLKDLNCYPIPADIKKDAYIKYVIK